MAYFWEVVEAQDKILINQLTSILNEFGWLGLSQVGRLATGTQRSMLQHDSVASKEKYARLLKASVLKKNPKQSFMPAWYKECSLTLTKCIIWVSN